MKKNILMGLLLSLSMVSLASASTEQFAGHLGEQKLSEITSGSYKCEFAKGNIEKEARNFGTASVSAPGAGKSSKAGIAR
jgi:hypothetical protein